MNKETEELLNNVEGGVVSSYSLGEVDLEDTLKSITVTEDSGTHELNMSEFYDKDVYLYYNRTTKLLPMIIGGQLIEVHIREDDSLAYIAVKKGDVVYVLAFDEITDCPKWMPRENPERTMYHFVIGIHPWAEWEDKELEDKKI